MILDTLRPFINNKNEILFIDKDDEQNILINSNFNCNFFINREKLYNILNSEKYGIESAYDPCSYPGVKCKFYFNNNYGIDYFLQTGKVLVEDQKMKLSELVKNNKYTEISFMIFRTGSCLIVGNCTETILNFVFEFIKKILTEEYNNIRVDTVNTNIKNKKTKIRKKTIFMTTDYYSSKCVLDV